jgi:hypothetical protein
MRKQTSFLLSFCMLVLLGCVTTMATQSDWDASAQFSSLKTYSWASNDQPLTGNPRLDNSLVDSRIRAAIDEQLAAQGYQKTNSAEVDFQVAYHASIEGKLDTTTFRTPSYGAGAGLVNSNNQRTAQLLGNKETTFVTEYEEGTLLLDIIDPRTQKLIWRGSVSDVLNPKRTSEQKQAKIKEAVGKLLSQFPPK